MKTKAKQKVLAMVLALTMVFAMVPLMGAQKAYAFADGGAFTIDLTNGPITYDYETVVGVTVVLFALASDYSKTITVTTDEAAHKSYMDLDKDGTIDVVMLADEASNGPPKYTFEEAETCSISGALTFKVTEEQVTAAFSNQGLPDELLETLSFYNTLTFVFKTKAAPAPVAKAANTLTLKGKTFKVKAKQLKKKAKKFSISKVVAVTGAQGAVTYAKKSGNKKITMTKTGKVTVKKGLKKGTYKVKVNVTAAGNDAYDPVTKTVTFKIKVK